MKTLDEIKQMMAAGDTAQADEALKELLAKEPANLQAKMLYGTCRQLLGDEETFKRIHDELMPKMDALQSNLLATDDVLDDSPTTGTEGSHEGRLPPDLKMWQQYHQTYFGLNSFALTLDDADPEDGLGACHLYGAPSMDEIIKIRDSLERRRKVRHTIIILCLLLVFALSISLAVLLTWWLIIVVPMAFIAAIKGWFVLNYWIRGLIQKFRDTKESSTMRRVDNA